MLHTKPLFICQAGLKTTVTSQACTGAFPKRQPAPASECFSMRHIWKQQYKDILKAKPMQGKARLLNDEKQKTPNYSPNPFSLHLIRQQRAAGHLHCDAGEKQGEHLGTFIRSRLRALN